MAQVDLNEYNGGRLVGATIALLALSWITIGLRTYTRAVIMRSFQADDWLMLVAQVRCFGGRGFGVQVANMDTDCLYDNVCLHLRRCSQRHGTTQCSHRERR